MDELKCLLNVSVGHKFLARVASVHHEGVYKTFNDWAAGLPEPNLMPSASTVSSRCMVSSLDILGDGLICACGGGGIPFAEELELHFLFSHSK